MKFKLLHPADQLVMIMERIYGYGMTTTSGGNLSILDDNGDIWITPAGVDKGSLTRKDIVRVKPDGEIDGIHEPSSEFPFHKRIYEKRPDLKAIIHAHPSALVSFSIVREIPDTKLIPNAHLVCGPVTMADYAVPGSEELGEKIAEEFEEGYNSVMLENHGVVLGNENLFKTFMAFETLDFCARLEIKANQIGEPNALTEKQIERTKLKQDVEMDEFIPRSFSSKERDIRREMCELIHRAYEQKLFTSTQGTFSQRLGEDSFVITPYGVDRKYIEISDLVRISGGQMEANKTPSRSTGLHKYIYEQYSDINSIIIAHPHNIMSFAVTEKELKTTTIPESYIMLENIPKVPFGSSFLHPKMVANCFSDRSILMVENDCVIVTGDSLVNTFDKLEVAEFTARSIIYAQHLGEIVNIDDKQIKEIEEVFGL